MRTECRPSRFRIASWTLILWGVLLAAGTPRAQSAQAACRVDPETIGIWELPRLGGRWLWNIRADGTFSFQSEAADWLGSQGGTFSASDGHWTLRATSGYTDGGTYTLQSSDTLIAVGRHGMAVWHRADNAARS